MKKRKSYENNEKPKGKQEEKDYEKSVKVMAAAMAAMMALTGCGSKTAETTAADTTAAETTAEAASEETTTEAAGVELADGEYTVGIGQFPGARLLRQLPYRILQGLADEGIVEGKNLTVLYGNTQADGGTASQIMNNFLSKKADLICAIATPIAQSAYSAAKDTGVPVIYTAVTDPGSGRACKRRRNSGW